MAKTSPHILFGPNAIEIKDDIDTINVSDSQQFSIVSSLKSEILETKFASFELDQWLLDGSHHLLSPNGEAIGWVTASISDQNGHFANSPWIEIEFSSLHSSKSITFQFAELTNDYPTYAHIEWFDGNGAFLDDYVFEIDASILRLDYEISGFKSMTIEFNDTNKPYRFIRLVSIDFDALKRFTGADVRAASIVEQISLISAELYTNSFEFIAHADDGSLDITNRDNILFALYEGRPIDVYENVDNVLWYFGRFYLDRDGWESLSSYEARIQCSDIIGLLDKIPYRFRVSNLIVFLDWSAGLIIETILQDLGLDYAIDSYFYSVDLTGYLPQGSVRDALQQIAIASGAYIWINRSNTIYVSRFNPELLYDQDYTYTDADVHIESPLSLRPSVTGVEVTAHNFTADGLTSTEVYNQNLTPGTYTLEFAEPHYLYTITAGSATITKVSGHTVTINVSSTSTVKITAGGYVDSKTVFSVKNTNLPPEVSENVVEVIDCTMINASYALSVAENLYYYYQLVYSQRTKVTAKPIRTGDNAWLELSPTKDFSGFVEAISIDLAGGLRQELEITGIIMLSNMLQKGKYNNTSLAFTFEGSWQAVEAYTGAYLNDIRGSTGGSLKFNFIGIKMKVIYLQLPGTSKWEVFIDGRSYGQIDQNGVLTLQKEWDSGYLFGLAHSVELKWVSSVPNIDAIEII